jgi:hypothetical protein
MPIAALMRAMFPSAIREVEQLGGLFEVELVARSLAGAWVAERVLDEARRLVPQLARFPEVYSAVSAMMLCIATACAGLFAIDLKEPDTEMQP